MTTTSYTTTGDIPPSAWAALLADMRRLLTVLEADGTAITGPTGTGEALLTDEQIGFTATAPQTPPLTVTFTRAAGSGQTQTGHPATTGMTLAAMSRAARHWGQLFTWTSDADLVARALADTLATGLFGEEDQAVTGTAPLSMPSRAGQLMAEAAQVAAAADTQSTTLVGHLDAVIAALTAMRTGIAAAQQLLTPTAHAQDEPAPDPVPAKRAPAKRARARKATQ